MSQNNTPSSSDSDTSRKNLKSAEERLMVAVRIRPLRNDENQRILYAVNKKVCAFYKSENLCPQLRQTLLISTSNTRNMNN